MDVELSETLSRLRLGYGAYTDGPIVDELFHSLLERMMNRAVEPTLGFSVGMHHLFRLLSGS